MGSRPPTINKRPLDPEKVRIRRGRNGQGFTLPSQAAALIASHRRRTSVAAGATHFLAPGKRGWPVSSRHLSSPIRHLSSPIPHPPFVTCHPAFVTCHFSFPIPHSPF